MLQQSFFGQRMAFNWATIFLFFIGAIACHPSNVQAAERSAPESATIDIHMVRPGVWVHTSYYTYPDGTRYPSNGLIVREGNGLLLVDTAWGESLTVTLLGRIKSEIGLPVRRAVVTHAHGDRIAGVDALEARRIEVYSLPLTQKRAIGEGMPVPDHALAGLDIPGSSVKFGSVELFYPGPAHAPDNIMVWVPSEHILFGGCAVRAAAATSLGGIADANRVEWPEAIRRARSHYSEATVVVPGHGAIGDLKLLDHTLSLFED
ncbi:subclass B1 metallo-beta-lactamase [Sinimarinibacterium sp. NLF-5-8]|uniref:subclass B1 metallo-beta-lactamase n=1 Tax=Sinimarinibacterium sp. NLF-5-8 TaxID=2698684 RepID=UPI001EE43572|nr:subclass B1 metallo-beta-lactamase [Sinimarinibacterium sp. NLF-5-8]